MRSISFILVLFTVLSVEAQKSNAYAQMLSLDRSNILFSGEKNGFDFEDVKFKFQFVNCKGEVKLGVTYDKKASFTKFRYKGKSYNKSQVGSALWPKSQEIEINDVSADLYFGSRKLGKVFIKFIPKRYTGCSGTMYDVLKDVGLRANDKVYKSNIKRLMLRNIKVLRAGSGDEKRISKIAKKIN
ncbi:hypothetical protein AAON49_04890 [Pseudotenacibaculum sp. MALMAid0570]|uniref:hypothetical protein n=1 Tax=Pseudotenacibaculum sp. MALMAid0570 TaxID=3143938 RepID=UPI0032DEE742